ncbi:MAG TPA: protein-L-isoaspartate(D-aspartate) O-methyltransferase [Methylomirabilota bacterium]|jgi:protein-L-isoaspartate(D-aspartate) O-methyltransferase|nr:protein-L-isoaspartate(D-aspartate) O-methyltransferase [Methylomirabilota bacterium]
MTGGRAVGTGAGWQEARAARERERMVAEQLVGRGITDARVLDAMRRIPRHRFVEEALRDRAYGDHPLPIGESQTISQPYIVGMMTQLLALTGSEKVLEIGTGSGYQTAVLAELVRRVCSVERLMPLAVQARRILEELGYTNAVVKTADGTYGWADEAPFERIIVTAGAPAVPTPLFQQLAEGGRMVVPVGGPQSQVLHVVEKIDGRMRLSTDCGCTFVKLVGKYGWET